MIMNILSIILEIVLMVVFVEMVHICETINGKDVESHSFRTAILKVFLFLLLYPLCGALMYLCGNLLVFVGGLFCKPLYLAGQKLSEAVLWLINYLNIPV